MNPLNPFDWIMLNLGLQFVFWQSVYMPGASRPVTKEDLGKLGRKG